MIISEGNYFCIYSFLNCIFSLSLFMSLIQELDELMLVPSANKLTYLLGSLS